MVKLVAKTPCNGLLPVTVGTISIAEVETGTATLVAPFKGRTKAVSEAMKAALGVGFPAPNRVLGTGPRVIWCGKGQALVVGADCPAIDGAACVDHSDAWAVIRIDGADAPAVLARLTPIDLRPTVFKGGHTARTLLGHMHVSITRLGKQSFEVMIMRSMAGTLVHEVQQAAENVSARG